MHLTTSRSNEILRQHTPADETLVSPLFGNVRRVLEGISCSLAGFSSSWRWHLGGRSRRPGRATSNVFQDLARGVQARQARHAVTRMCAGAAQIQPFESACDSAPIPAADAW